MPNDIKTTRNHSWNVALQQQLGENMAFSATYLGNRMVNMWGVVDGNPGVIPAGATATGPCTLRLPTGGTQTFANCSTAPLDLRREFSQVESAGRAVLRLPGLDHAMPGGRTITGCCCRCSAVHRRAHRQRQLHDLDVRRAHQPGSGAAQRRDGIHETDVD